MTSLVKIPKGNIRTEQEISRTGRLQKRSSKMKKKILEKEREAQRIHQGRIRAGPGTSVYLPLEGILALPGCREEAECNLLMSRAKQSMKKEKPFRLSPLLIDEHHFVPIKKTVKKEDIGLGSRSASPLTPEPIGPTRSPILDIITKQDLVKKRSPPTSPKNYPGKEGTGEKAAKIAQMQHLKTQKHKSKYYGGKKRRKTRKRKRRRKRKTKRRKKKRKRRRTRKKRGGKEEDNDKGGKRWKQMKSMKNIIDLEFDSLNLQPHYPIDANK